MIEIVDLQEKTLEEIIDLLLDEKNESFEIYVPKSTQLYFSDRFAIADDYLEAAYSGQMLSDISEEFKYEVVSPEDHENILFEIKCKDITKLAEALMEISYIYVNDHPDPEYIMYEELQGFLSDIESGTVPACPEFLKIYQEFVVEEEVE